MNVYYLMQKLRTRIMERDVNPVWNEDLTIFVYDPDLPIKLVCSYNTCLLVRGATKLVDSTSGLSLLAHCYIWFYFFGC